MAYDTVVVGAGPAGLTAAIYLRRAGRSVLVIEKGTFGGQITYSPFVENYPGFAGLSGNELGEKMVDQAVRLGAEIELDEVTGIKDYGAFKTVSCQRGEYTAKTVIVAAGSRHRHLGLDREEELIGSGVAYCALCDGAFYKGQPVAVIGGGNTALQDAVLLSEGCSHVTVVQNLATCTGEAKLMDILKSRANVSFVYNTVVEELIGEESLTGIALHDTASGAHSQLDVKAIFIAIGQVPDNGPFDGICDLDEHGYILADESTFTATPGVFAAGDCRSKTIRQVVTATGDGAAAAMEACRYMDRL